MSYCINPDCSQPQNQPTDEICRNCGSKLLLKERYRAVKVLGQGGFGRTYLAIDQDRLNASCVIKQFLPQVQGTGALQKATELFYQEAIRLNDLGVHPQIPDLLAFFTQDKRQYLVQEFVPGMNLQKLLERHGNFTEAEIWAILRDILPILEFVHERQVIHRDIKPENIIRRQGDNKLFLIDFGVAKLLTDPQRVITGTSIGTSGYVPIEQMSEGKAYPASDIYSLGVTCFHLLTGVSPYSLFIKRGYSWLQTWQDYVPADVTPRLIQVLDRMMQERRQDRYSTATEALKDVERLGAKNTGIRTETKEDREYVETILREIITTEPKPSQEKDSVDEFLREVTSSKTEVISPLNDDLFEKIIQDLDTPAPRQNPVSQVQTEDDEFITAFVEDVKRTGVANSDIPPTPVVSSTYSAQEEETISQLWRCAGTIHAHDQGCAYVGITPREIILTTGQRKIAKLWDMETGAAKGIVIKEDTCSTCSGLGKIYKEGSLLFVKTKQAVICPDCEGFGTNSEKGERFLVAKLSADGNTLVTATLDKQIKVWHVPTCKFTCAISTEPAVASMLAISGNGKVVSYVTQNRTIVVYSLEQQQETAKLKRNGIITCIDMSYDGNILLIGTEEGNINVCDVTTAVPPLNVRGHQNGITAVALSQDGMLAVSGCRDGQVRVWSLSTSNLVHVFSHHLAPISAMAIAPDNLTLATGSIDGMLCIWHLGRGNLLDTFPAHSDRITAIGAGADGQTFATASLDSTVKVWRSF
ncbi:MAG: protein kinase [Pseudanabaenaceae cyanobacterium SKYGB_i_bin29]|nr:protein kinase [Pseudanabaenaceae cyanobacterium SKYG29]MDW8421899.1 protein kinase [Pseudanabaenaceae cyanobacterium SKYGB_i_bin29]